MAPRDSPAEQTPLLHPTHIHDTLAEFVVIVTPLDAVREKAESVELERIETAGHAAQEPLGVVEFVAYEKEAGHDEAGLVVGSAIFVLFDVLGDCGTEALNEEGAHEHQDLSAGQFAVLEVLGFVVVNPLFDVDDRFEAFFVVVFVNCVEDEVFVGVGQQRPCASFSFVVHHAFLDEVRLSVAMHPH